VIVRLDGTLPNVMRSIFQTQPEVGHGEASRRRHGLPASASVQRAVTALSRDDAIERRPDGTWQIAEPFLEEWLERGATDLHGGT